ncbi:hypothetical protein SAMN02745704_01733 [Paucidesulfovibrio gracilis DSM 16080]|uniref:Uncharacterized protein n=1 Tax=Paucidesulfovibrio gracilis DSM 16080 TaxID=1121449 RepID=A0A1T4X3Q1_9BACT|nr:hypothetical protein [Paucidesulfovibrio gracilis]SKA84176.1 hypothetical protein SAMN02745704_01733 [Paucidesulfovibrio gracilis DSM 16080]
MAGNMWKTMEVMVKGIFLGGSLGAIVGWTGLIPLPKAVALGMLCGCLASLTFRDRMDSRQKKDGEQDRE